MGIIYKIVVGLFRLAITVFYSGVFIVDSQNVPGDGVPTIIVANHANSLVDAMLLLSCAPRMVRLTAKATLWKTKFFSWFIRGVGTVPIKRRHDYVGGQKQDNTDAFSVLLETLGGGACIGLFPEGISRYFPAIAPLKPGVGVIARQFLESEHARGRALTIVPVSLTYLHREKFRSDVLVWYGKPVVLGPNDIESLRDASGLVRRLQTDIETRTLHSQDWSSIRLANTARTLYAPHGTLLPLHHHVALTKKFIDALGGVPAEPAASGGDGGATIERSATVRALRLDLDDYQTLLDGYKLKDERIRRPRTPGPVLIWRIVVRVALFLVLGALAVPGLVLMSPALIAGKWQERRIMKLDLVRNADEIAMYKLTMAAAWLPFAIGLSWWMLWFVFPLNLVLGPVVLWMTIRWMEDAVACLRSIFSLSRLLVMPKAELTHLRDLRSRLRDRVVALAAENGIDSCDDVECLLGERSSYFSPWRRRKKDWTETLRMESVSTYLAPDPYPEETVDGGSRVVIPAPPPRKPRTPASEKKAE